MTTDATLMAYCDGELSAEEAREIEAALASDPALRDRLQALKSSDERLKGAFDVLLDKPVPDRLAAMVRAAAQAQAQAQPASADVVAFKPRPAAPRHVFGGAPAWLGWAVAAQISLIIIGGAVLQPRPQAGDDYHVLGAKPAAAAANAMVIFKPETPERDLRAALRSVDARIVGGPTPADAYLIQVAPTGRAAALTELRQRRDIVVAEPIDADRSR